jgi:hypothetical protein
LGLFRRLLVVLHLSSSLQPASASEPDVKIPEDFSLVEHSVLDATQAIEHGLGADVGIKQAQRRVAVESCIRRLKPIECGGWVDKDFARASRNT